jgi:hypothetical protein
MNNILEILRYTIIGIGIFLTFYIGGTAVEQFHTLFLFIIIPMNGLTGIEGVFFAEGAAKSSGYGTGSAYQRQSGMNNLAVALAAILVYVLKWGFYAEAALILVVLLFFSMSGLNHLYSAIKENNKITRSYIRPIMTLLLDIAVLIFLIRALAEN